MAERHISEPETGHLEADCWDSEKRVGTSSDLKSAPPMGEMAGIGIVECSWVLADVMDNMCCMDKVVSRRPELLCLFQMLKMGYGVDSSGECYPKPASCASRD